MANMLIKEISRFKRREKKKDFEINLVMFGDDELYLEPMEIFIGEFGKLSTGKAQSLSKHLGFDTVIHEPMTIAEMR